jgi:NDP-sugar pyrophosphorylase family protein
MDGAFIIRVNTLRPEREYSFSDSEFDEIIEAGYDYIVITGPSYRLTSTIDDWLDYGTHEESETRSAIVLRTNRMVKA